jgi:hypothetical protein
MEINWAWKRAAIIALCVGSWISGCQGSREDEKVSIQKEVVQAPVQKEVAPPKQREDVRIIGFMIGTGMDAHNEIKNPGSKYHSGDTISALVRTDGSGPDATLKVRCKDASGNVLFEESKKITPKGSDATPFTLSSTTSLPVGEYHLESLLDDYHTMSVGFEITE